MNVLIVCWTLRLVSLSGLPPGNTRQPAPRLFSTVGLELVPCYRLPMGSHTRTTSTHHCGKCCGTTWRGPGRLRTGLCSWDKAAALCPGTQSLIHKQQRSNAASCCLHQYILVLAPRTASSAHLQQLCRSVVG